MAKHYVTVSDEVWKELARIQKQFKVDKHALVDDIIALAGDLDAIAEAHKEEEKVDTRAAVLTPNPDELADLI